MIQIILLAALTSVAAYAASQLKRAPSVSFLMIVLSLIGGTLVLAPDISNTIANYLGVGRGADLVLYCFVVLSLGAIFNIHLRLRRERETVTAIVREMAILNAVKGK